jgi:serine/threonine protein kinase/Tol biopolymer transport system component
MEVSFMPGAYRPSHLARFEGFELDVRAGELRGLDGATVRLPEQSLRILVLLLEHPSEVVSREEIRKKLWPNDTIVEFEHSISAAINRLRQALRDSADKPKYVETLARRGYRWMVSVEWAEGRPAQQQAVAADKRAAESIDGRFIGKKVSHYRVLRILGGGGMGVVYEAEDLKLGRRVALKFLPEELASDPATLNRFEREARAASSLSHPNICTIYEVEEHEENPFIVMELLEGETLRETISRSTPGTSPFELQKLLDLATQICDGLDAAHHHGIIHRDIKPANIFITTRGRAKILDFGLAKLSRSASLLGDIAEPGGKAVEAGSNRGSTQQPPETDAFLSFAGEAMGTAGYMSPEQIRGETLDIRTDLFSFGLVLYEMATGKRAFAGDAGLAPHNAVLSQVPSPARGLNAELPAKLDEVIHKALEKDREARYETASEMQVDLENLKEEAVSKGASPWRAVAAGVIGIGVIASAIFWFARHQRSSSEAVKQPVLRQLTLNSFENSVEGGAVSPDGKYVAYSDKKGLHIKVIETGEIRSVPQPEALSGKDVEWDISSAVWFPDSTRFLANAHPFGQLFSELNSHDTSIWVAPVSGGAPRKLRDTAIAYAVSPDGSLIAFGDNSDKHGDREIWLMGPDGEQARKLYDTGGISSLEVYTFSPDRQRILYSSTDQSGTTIMNGDLKGSPPTIVFSPTETEKIRLDLTWLPDGRLIYPVPEPGSFAASCNYWAVRLDERTGRVLEKPGQLTNWTGFCMSSTTATADGKQLVFLKQTAHMTSYVADLAAHGTRILNPKHFPLTETSDVVSDWLPDSKSFLLVSNRSGHYAIYKQSLDEETPEILVAQGYGRDAHTSPDGKSVIYFGVREDGPLPWPTKGPEPVMRVSISGGPSQQLFAGSPGSLLTCARSPSDLCAIGETTADGRQLVVTAFDQIKGRGPELFRVALASKDANWSLNLSPDGTRFAAVLSMAGPIYIFSLRGEVLQQIRLNDWSNLQSSAWAANGESLFVTAGTREGVAVLHVDLQSDARVLWENPGSSWETLVHPSPDGRYLEFDRWTATGNMWMMENF